MFKESVPGGWPAKCHFGTGVGKRFAERGGGVSRRGGPVTEPLSIGSRRTRPGSEPNEHLFFFKKVSPRCGPQNDQCVRCHFQRAHFHCTQQQASGSLQETTATNHRPIGNDNHHHSRSALFLVSQSANCVPNVALVFQHWCHISSAPHFAIPKFCTFLVPPPPPVLKASLLWGP